ncbi:Ger(x)C family spore germination protein [Paenibacillus sp. MMS20-IR301]|uniref:Ger(x)C family spore germination protein n=1 Tax=Paenibacillus sp. MMS20-IR301 TaxID=2895946 RepID=UPI0028E4D54D|nr:Ger(x)C family spore germination protein [Paenibacillus sp. MMS20-IR301]WNS44904.1 Ger(x)C family spore germination protein [Paenibacillus sp. MMS20-IR301]
MNRRLTRALSVCLPLLLLTVLLSGCWERKELNELAFVLALGLDKAESGYKVTMQVVIPSSITSQSAGGAGGGGVPVVTYSYKVPTIYESLRKFNLISSRTAYFGHIRVLVLGEELARSGIGETLDVLKRSREPRMDFYTLVAKQTTAESILKVLTPLDRLPANKLFNALDKSYKISARTVAVTLDTLIEDMLYEGINPVLTGVEVTGDAAAGDKKSNIEQTTPSARLRYEDVAVFRKDKLIGWLDEEETVGYNYITDKVTKNTGHFKDKDGSIVVIEGLQAKTKRKVKIINGEPHIYLRAEAFCNVEEVEGADKLDTEGKIRSLEEESEDRIVQRMKDVVEQVNSRYNVDIFGFGRSIYRTSPGTWARLQEQNREGYLRSLPIHYEASVTINRIGLIDNSFLEDIKE